VVEVVVLDTLEVVVQVVIELLVMDQHLYKDVVYFYQVDVIQLQLVQEVLVDQQVLLKMYLDAKEVIQFFQLSHQQVVVEEVEILVQHQITMVDQVVVKKDLIMVLEVETLLQLVHHKEILVVVDLD
jgi:hypothetical protein